MQSDYQVPSKAALWGGYIISGLVSLFLLFDGIMKLVKPAPIVEATTQLGYPEGTIVGMRIALIISMILYIIPQTSVLGAILLTGYLGGAVATHVRVQGPVFNIVFPVIFGILIWGALYLRNLRLRRIIPLLC